MRGLGASVLIPMMLCLGGCAAQYAATAGRARSGLIGMTGDDLRMCAGHPANIDKSDDSEIWMYERGGVTTPGISVASAFVPWAGIITQPTGGYCRVQLRMRAGHVAEVEYAGETDIWGAQDAACAPIIRTCLERRTGSR